MSTPTKITDKRIIKYFDECVSKLKEEGIMPNSWGNDIDLVQNSAFHTFGSMNAPTAKDGRFTLYLSDRIFNDSEEAIKNTIYHELCHYIQMREQFDSGVIWADSRTGSWKIHRSDRQSGYESVHGGRWLRIAKQVSLATGHKITRTSDYDLHQNTGKEFDESVKYVIKCKKCGNVFKYLKKSPFVSYVLAGSPGKKWSCRCGGDEFEVIQGDE